MVIQPVGQKQYDALKAALAKKADICPHDAAYSIKMMINQEEYILRVQLEKHRRVALLQAQQILRQNGAVEMVLITQGALLSAFMQILIHQLI